MTSQWPIGDDGDFSSAEWMCSCSCGECGPVNMHDCGSSACNAGHYEIPEVPDSSP